jgi:predicted component of type VI protein secretion system
MSWLAFGTLTRELRDGEIVVGSGADADWPVATADLMPRHFQMTVKGPMVSLRPCSDNVVVVNGDQVVGTSRSIADGDAILAGSGRFVFTADAPQVAPVEPPATSQAYLIDEQARVAHPLLNRSAPIGRDASNAVVIRDPRASRFHAEIRREAGGFALHSIGASGTFLNGSVMASPSMLKEGDAIEIAFSPLRFTLLVPGADVAIAPPHSAENDEFNRKPTLSTDQVSDAGDPDSARLRLAVIVVAILVVGFVVWRVLAG